MNSIPFNRVTHFSVVWAVMLSFITIIEWRSLDREPLKPDILSPFIERHIEIVRATALPSGDIPTNSANTAARNTPQYLVELDFNGPLFLVCFFVPILMFHAIGALIARLRGD